jgi:hypothetical protein
MHAYIYNAQEEAEMKFSCIKLQRKEEKRSLCKRWPCDGRHEHLEILFDYGGNSSSQRNFRKN